MSEMTRPLPLMELLAEAVRRGELPLDAFERDDDSGRDVLS
jgi:hypothetical protein